MKYFVSGTSFMNMRQSYALLMAIGRALWHCKTINTFVYRHEKLIQYHITKEDWKAIKTKTQWLGSFHLATTQMSTTKMLMLSSTHAIFCGLQAELKDALHNTHGLTPQLIQGLTDAHQRLSNYYYKFNDSPFYLWASHRSFCLWLGFHT